MSVYHSRLVGHVDAMRESYFAISPERKIKHPAVLHIKEVAAEALHA